MTGRSEGMNNRATFGADTTADKVLEGIDVQDKLVLVTGASSGLGQETTRALAAKGARVVMTARDMSKGEAVAAGIRESTGNTQVEVEELELASLASVRAFAPRFLAKHPRLDVLINNAGVMACPLGRTADGFEMQFGTNHVGHFLLACLLVPALRAAAPSRIVSVSSRGHHISAVDFDDPNFERRAYHKWEAYGQSKTANVLLAVGLERRLANDGVHANALHPGAIITELGRHLQPEDIQFLQSRAPAGSTLQFKPIPAGAATTVYAATAPELEGRGGLYLEDCHVAQINDAPNALDGAKSYALDAENAERLWKLSEQLVGERMRL
jgi:NAD(P)-dependent dehydrogenase (short-subunit alcohol dehydrogenase family)